jgi:hypothetical protein
MKPPMDADGRRQKIKNLKLHGLDFHPRVSAFICG